MLRVAACVPYPCKGTFTHWRPCAQDQQRISQQHTKYDDDQQLYLVGLRSLPPCPQLIDKFWWKRPSVANQMSLHVHLTLVGLHMHRRPRLQLVGVVGVMVAAGPLKWHLGTCCRGGVHVPLWQIPLLVLILQSVSVCAWVYQAAAGTQKRAQKASGRAHCSCLSGRTARWSAARLPLGGPVGGGPRQPSQLVCTLQVGP